jgi:hypothetical protein
MQELGHRYKVMENQDECCYNGWETQRMSGVINIEVKIQFKLHKY